MAIKLLDKPNVRPQDSDYIYGAIKDDDGSGGGTPVNTLVYGDFHQFFARLLDKGGVTPNGVPDNAYSGFQLYDALIAVRDAGIAAEAILRASADAALSARIAVAEADWIDHAIVSGNVDPRGSTISSVAKGIFRHHIVGKTLSFQLDLDFTFTGGDIFAVWIDLSGVFKTSTATDGIFSGVGVDVGTGTNAIFWCSISSNSGLLKCVRSSSFSAGNYEFVLNGVINIQ